MYGSKAGNNPWQALTLEWMTSSPPAIENFDKTPVLATGPYDYGLENTRYGVPLSDPDPNLSAGPNSVLRADPDEPYPSIAAEKEEG
jgi:cytochrome c oxidase subunit 1